MSHAQYTETYVRNQDKNVLQQIKLANYTK